MLEFWEYGKQLKIEFPPETLKEFVIESPYWKNINLHMIGRM